MRRWGIVAILYVMSVAVVVAAILMPAVAFAQAPAGDVAATADDPPPPPPLRVGYGAMPGGLHVAAAEALPAGTVAVALMSGYGSRSGLLGSGRSFSRAVGALAVAYVPVPNLAFGLSLDGRYDKHTGVPPSALDDNDDNDDNYVGAPHLLARYSMPRGKLAFGGQLGIWLPGEDAPSIAVSAISVDARALMSIDAGFGTVSANAGFRIDNSAKSVDDPTKLTVEDQVSLGVSEFHAALAGVSLRIPTGNRAYVELEGSTEVFVGSGAPGPIFRGGALAGVALSDSFAIVGFVELARVRRVASTEVMMKDVVLIPYEPTVTGGIGLQARFGGTPKRRPSGWIIERKRPPVEVLETADVRGFVLDDAGKPVVGAKVEVKLKNRTGMAVTDDKGAYEVEKLPIGKTIDGKTELDDAGAEVAVEVANKKPGTATLTLVKGSNLVPPITLDPMLPPGQLRAVIINVGTSRPVAGATVTIEPGGVTATSGQDGKFTVDLPPGQYKLTVNARGLAQQQLDVTIDPNGVAIKNIELHK
jgi:hypothetical protein